MSNLSINQLLSQLQNVPLPQQTVADAASSDATGDQTVADASTGQDLPDAPATAASATNTEGASAPVISPDMTAVLLQLQESQEMTDARALLYGDGSNASSTSLFGTASSSTDPLQAFLDQMNTTDASLTSSNQTLLDYLSATGTTGDQTTMNTAGAGQTTSNQTLLDYLNATDTTGDQTTTTSDPLAGLDFSQA